MAALYGICRTRRTKDKTEKWKTHNAAENLSSGMTIWVWIYHKPNVSSRKSKMTDNII